MKFKVASASEYLAITGYGIDDIKLAKKSWVLPGQSCTVFDVSPENYTFQVQAMSAEKLPFVLPAVFTIGPQVEDEEALLRYARLISPHDKNSNHVHELVQGVIEGETRVLAASMTMEEIFRGTKQFKQEVFAKVQLELNQFGLLIYNANVKQLVDVPGHEYFSYLGQKTQMEAANQTRIDVSEAKMKGESSATTKIYSTQRQGEGQKEEIKVKTDIKIFANEREAEVAEANSMLAAKKADWARLAQVAEVEAGKAVAIREAELQMELEKRNAMTQTEKMKAEMLSKATVAYETKRVLDAGLYEMEKEAQGRKASADAALYTPQQEAEAELYTKKKEAEGLIALADAQSYQVKRLLEALGGDNRALRDYMMANMGVYQEMARINAGAIQGLAPKISLWTTTSIGDGPMLSSISTGGGASAMQQVAGVYKMLPPLLTTVHEQTGMLPPSWLGSLPERE
ncbi:hypothetical protein AMTRI_Chr08g208960 [Amborella trichopoda]